jgi:hemerythrin superfamily protein
MKNSLNEKENEDDYIFQNLTRSKEDERDKLLEDILAKF